MEFNPSNLKYNFKEFIGIYENAFTKKECENAIKLFELHCESGYSYSRFGEGNRVLNRKDDTSVNINPSAELDCDLEFIKEFNKRFYDYIYPIYNVQYPILQNLQKHQPRYIKIQKTYPTQGYHVWHCEHNILPDNRDRILSWILYLNDVEEGGETEFLYQSLRFKPKTGTFVLFPAYFTHPHRGNPPLSGIKYIATGWVEFLHTTEIQGEPIFPKLNNKNSELKNKNISYT